MRVSVLAASDLRLFYRFASELAVALAAKGHSVALIDLTSGSSLRSLMSSMGLMSPFSQRSGASFVHYSNVPVEAMPQEHASALLSISMRGIKNQGADVVVELAQSEQVLELAQAVYRDTFGDEEGRLIIAIDAERAIAYSLVRRWNYSRSKGVIIAVLYTSPQIASQILEKTMEFLSSHGEVHLVKIPQDPVPESFSNITPGEDVVKLAERLLAMEAAAHPEAPSIDAVVEGIKGAKLATIVGSSFSNRDLLVKRLLELFQGRAIAVNAPASLGQGAVSVQLLPGFTAERSKVKSFEDVIRLSKRLAEDLVKEAERRNAAVIVIYSAGVTPWAFGLEQKSTSYSFWSSLITHLRENLKRVQIFIVCDNMVEDCSPLEAISDVSLRCTEGGLPQVLRKVV